MRGKGLWLVADFVFLGITPAYAGKSGFGSSSSAECWDHPRVCGEKQHSERKVGTMQGSPPRMRGKGFCFQICRSSHRITPAYAGKSYTSIFHPPLYKDHPRVCGEKKITDGTEFVTVGSPPRMRGKDMLYCDRLPQFGITPAYAGKRCSAAVLLSSSRDHPRVCGEKSKKKANLFYQEGSPPRMRGKDLDFWNKEQIQGITPAYAGKRALRSCLMNHPSGSPPRMRGKD